MLTNLKDIIVSSYSKVAPSELETVLLSHPAVADAGVTSIPDEEAGELPQAWVVLKPGQACSEAEIQAYITGTIHRTSWVVFIKPSF